MPRVHFTITSVSRSLFDTLTKGYHGHDEDDERGNILERWLRRLKKRIDTWQSRHDPSFTPDKEAAVRAAYPMFDPQFLLFALLVADYLNRGYIIGRLGHDGQFSHYDECTLSGPIPNCVTLSDGSTLPMGPHKYNADIGDIPEYARLKKLQHLTRDASISALINRLMAWMQLFVLSDQYSWRTVARHPATGEVKLLTSSFFKKFPRSMTL